jgi:hypothetical protein
MNKKIASEIAIGIILLLAIFVGLLFWMQGENGNNMTAIPDNISPQKESSINKQTWHTENDNTYIDELYKFSAQYPKGWFLEESLPIGPNDGGWKRRIAFSNYDFKNDFNISNSPNDYKIFEFVLDGSEDCNKAVLNGYEVTTDINKWKKSFDTIRAQSKEYSNLSATKLFQFNSFCLNVDAFYPENNGADVKAEEKINIIRNFAKSFQFIN